MVVMAVEGLEEAASAQCFIRGASAAGAVCRTAASDDGCERNRESGALGEQSGGGNQGGRGELRAEVDASHFGSCSSSRRVSFAARIGAFSGANIVW